MNYPGGEQPLFAQHDLGGFGYPQQPAPPKRTGLIVMFLVVALLLVGAGAMGFLYFNEVQNNGVLTSELATKDQAVAAANKQTDNVNAQLKVAQDASAADQAKLKSYQDTGVDAAAKLKAAQDATAAAQAQVAAMSKCNAAAKAVVAANGAGVDPQHAADLGAELLAACAG